jgi:hypothetical protein
MNKFSLALALGTGLTLGAAAPAARASATGTQPSTIQTLSAANMSAAEFNALFKPDTAAQNSTIDFNGAPGSGILSSQVFAGGKDAATGTDATGLYAYAYQVAVNNVTNAQGEPTHIDGASWQFNATPTGTGLAGAGTNFAYTIKDGAVGGLTAPTADGSAPSLSWQPGTTIGSIRANFVDPTTQAPPLTPGETSATFVVLSTQPPASNFQYAGVLSSNPQTGAPAVFSPSAGAISPIPIPEPTTVLAWAGMAGAVVLARRTRKARLA